MGGQAGTPRTLGPAVGPLLKRRLALCPQRARQPAQGRPGCWPKAPPGVPGHFRASRACPGHHLLSGAHLLRGARGPALGQPCAGGSEARTQKLEHPAQAGCLRGRRTENLVLRGSGHRLGQALKEKQKIGGEHSRPGSAAGREVAQGTCGTHPPQSVAGRAHLASSLCLVKGWFTDLWSLMVPFDYLSRETSQSPWLPDPAPGLGTREHPERRSQAGHHWHFPAGTW